MAKFSRWIAAFILALGERLHNSLVRKTFLDRLYPPKVIYLSMEVKLPKAAYLGSVQIDRDSMQKADPELDRLSMPVPDTLDIKTKFYTRRRD